MNGFSGYYITYKELLKFTIENWKCGIHINVEIVNVIIDYWTSYLIIIVGIVTLLIKQILIK